MTHGHKITGAEALIRAIADEGIDTVFGYPGGTIINIYDKLYENNYRIKHLLMRHEQAAVHAAEGYARSTGKVGVCIATAGPGATNLVTGIADAMMDSTPIICITGQVSADVLGTNFFQEADMISVTIPITKWSYQITKAEEIPSVMAQAFYIAKSGRPGPVVISFTKNAQVELVDYTYNRRAAAQEVEEMRGMYSMKVDAQLNATETEYKLGQAAELLNNAEKPLIIAGQGVLLSGACDLLKQIAERANIPVASTLLGLGCMNCKNPLYLGMVGMHGNIAPNKMTQLSDAILAVGMRFSDRVTGAVKGYAPNARIIHIDIDKSEFDKNVFADIKLHGDAKELLSRLLPLLKFKERADWLEYGRQKRADEKQMITLPQLKSEGPLRMSQVIEALNDKFKSKRIVVTDVGQNQMFAARYIRMTRNVKWLTSGGLGTMGYSLPAAIGAKCGNPDAEVIAIMGDGGFQMNMQELGTIMANNINIKIVLMNNSFLGMVRQWQDLFFNKRYSFTHLDNPDFQMLCEAYGIEHKRVTNKEEMRVAVQEMHLSNKSYLIEAIIAKEENVFPMIPGGKTLDGIIYK